MASKFDKFKKFRLLSGENQIHTTPSMSVTNSTNTALVPTVFDSDNFLNYDRSRILFVQQADIAATGDDTIVLRGLRSAGEASARMFALLGNNLGPSATFRLVLKTITNVVTYDSGVMSAGDLIPLGDWVAGVDAYGGSLLQQNNTPLVIYFDAATWQQYEIHITAPMTDPLDPDSIQIRSAVLGDYVSVDYNFAYGAPMGYFTEPDLIQLDSGSFRERTAVTESKSFSMNLPLLGDGDRYTMKKHRQDMAGQPFLVIPYPEETSEIYADCTFLAIYANKDRINHDFWDGHSTQLEFVEA